MKKKMWNPALFYLYWLYKSEIFYEVITKNTYTNIQDDANERIIII